MTKDNNSTEKSMQDLMFHFELAKNARDASELAMKNMSKFLATTSHEVRTHMTVISSMAELLTTTEIDEEQKEFVEIIQTSTDSSLKIINDILDYSKIEAGKLEIENINFDLKVMIEETYNVLNVKAKEKNLEFTYNFDNSIFPHVIGDPSRIRQVIVNLVNNAIKFTTAGSVILNLKLQEETQTKSSINFEVTDTGKGIAEKDIEKLFKSFSQVNIKDQQQGTGLGLAISKKLVTLMNGDMSVKSEPGKGTTFSFLLNLQKNILTKQSSKNSLENLNNKKILIVDSSASDISFYENILSRYNCLVSLASSESHAISMLDEAKDKDDEFDLIIVHSQLSDMNGHDIGLKIKSFEKFSNLLMVMVTSAGYIGEAAKLQKIGFNAYIQKANQETILAKCLAMLFDESYDHKNLITRYSILEDRRKFKILVAEDHPATQLFMKKLLEQIGYQGKIVSNGKEAIELLKTTAFDIVFMDILMPVMDGFEAAMQIRKSDSCVLNNKIPIIALTTNKINGDTAGKYAKYGFNEFISKPINQKKLAKIIDSFLLKNNGEEAQKEIELPKSKKIQQYFELLKNNSFFQDIDQKYLLKLFDICKLENYNKDDVIIKEGNKEDSFYVLLGGNCIVTKSSTNGESIEIIKLDPGKHFGVGGIFTDTKRSANVIAENDVTVAKFSKQKLFKFFADSDKNNVNFLNNVIADLFDRLQERSSRLDNESENTKK